MGRRALGGWVVGLVLALTACGGGADRTTATEDEPGVDPPRVVGIVSATAAGGRPTERPTPLPDDDAVADYVRAFEGRGLGEQVERLVARNPPADGRVLAAAVVAVGCDVPPGAEVTGDDGDYRVVPDDVAAPLPECLAAVTSVAVVDLPA